MSSPMTEIQAVPGAQEVPGAKFFFRIRINERNHGNIRRERGKVKHKQRAVDPSTPLDARAEKKVVTRTSRMSSPCNRHANSMAGFCAAVSPEASKIAADPGARGKGQDMAWHH